MDENQGILEIVSVNMEPKGDRPSIVLGDPFLGRYLIVPLGPAEASLLIMFLEGLLPAKPLTHDLIVSFWEKHGFVPRRILFYEKTNDFYSCRLEYSNGTNDFMMETRASDAIILSVRAKIPIYANSEVLSTALTRDDLRSTSSGFCYKTGSQSPQIH